MLLQRFYCLKWNMLSTGVVYVLIDTYYFVIPIHEWTHKFMREWTHTWMNWYILIVEIKKTTYHYVNLFINESIHFL